MGRHELQKQRKRQREQDEHTNKRIEMEEKLRETTYDVESHARLNAHLLQPKRPEGAKRATFFFSIEGYPKDAKDDNKEAINEPNTGIEFYPSYQEQRKSGLSGLDTLLIRHSNGGDLH